MTLSVTAAAPRSVGARRLVLLLAVCSALGAAASPAGVHLKEEEESQFQTLRQDLAQRARFAQVAPETFRPEALITQADRDPVDVLLRRTGALLAHLKPTAAGKLAPLETRLAVLRENSARTALTNAEARRALFSELFALRREVAWANPLLNFDQVLFVKRHRAIYNHMCDQFYGITAAPGGGLYVLRDPFGPSPQVRDVLAHSVVEAGRLKGQTLAGASGRPPRLAYDGDGRLSGDTVPGGAFLSPSLSYDGKTILFAYVECQGDPNHRWHTDASRGHWAEGRCYHLFQVNVDGTGLRQLTDGTWNDFDPCWLPNGRIAFITERRGGYLRCGRVCPLYNLYDMAADGSDLNCLSFHESNEWHPSVTHDGRLIYTRWDYVDRHGCTAHVPWVTRLDGTDARAVHGNFAPREKRPDMELNVRAIPGSPKYVATAAPHHGQAFGSLIVINPQVPDDDAMGPVKRLTPEVAFPESQGGREVYGTPWPLSEDFYLCVYDAEMAHPTGTRRRAGSYGLYLVDSFGNKELIYRDPTIGCISPVPLRPTAPPPIAAGDGLATTRASASPGQPGKATLALMNVYDSLKPWPKETKITRIRILQLLPMSVPSGAPPHETGKRIGEAGDSVVPARWVLGTVPVEADGSAHFEVPAYRELFFQALDERGLAVQSMRSATYLRNGERLVCQGCHEPKSRASTAPASVPLALRRSPSQPAPDVDGSNPFSYPRLVQPVLDRNCVPCHTQKEHQAKAPNLAREPIQNKWYASYHNLVRYGFTSYGDGYRTRPGHFGARASKLLHLLDQGHHDLQLTADDYHRLALWLDCSSMFYGVFEQAGGELQLSGGVARPTLE